MIPHQRRLEIVKLLEEEGSAEVHHLAKLFKVTEVTIRKDLERLEQDGLIVKEHGGAFLKMKADKLLNLSTPNAENIEVKRRIGKAAASFVANGDTIIIDSGTTTTELAKQIANRANLTVITNSLSVALHLGSNPGTAVHMTGGEFKAPTLSLTGPQAAQFFDTLHVQKLFLSAMGMSLKTGLTYSGISDVIVKKAMIKSAAQVFLLADSSKFEKQSFASLGDINVIHTLITDAGLEPKHRAMLERTGIKIHIA